MNKQIFEIIEKYITQNKYPTWLIRYHIGYVDGDYIVNSLMDNIRKSIVLSEDQSTTSHISMIRHRCGQDKEIKIDEFFRNQRQK